MSKPFNLSQLADLNQAVGGSAITQHFNRPWIIPFGSTIQINVPADFATIESALYAISNWFWDTRNSTVTIKLADGTYNRTTSIRAAHPCWRSLRLIGNQTTPSNCIINVQADVPGLYAGSGNESWGLVDGLRFVRDGAKTNLGICADYGASIIGGTKIEVDGFYYGIAARYGSFIACPSAIVTDSGDVGIWAIRGSTIMAQNAVSSSADDSANSLGSGFAAEYASAIDASGAEAHNCWLAGFTSYTSSSIRAYAASSHDNTNDGVRVGWNGSIDFNTGATIEDNGGYGFHDVDGTGSWYAATPTLSGNVLGDYSKPLDLSTANALRVNRQYLDIRGYSDYAILRYLVDGTERARSEYRHDLGRYDVSVGSEIVMRAYTAGRTTIGPGAPATNATNFLQIPAMAGAPVGSPSVDTGYVPIVFDTTNNKLWVYDGGWIGTVLS